MFWSTPAAGRGPLGASRPRWSAPVGAWCCRAGDGPGGAGRLSVPGDGRGSDCPDPPWAGAPRWLGGAVAAAAAAACTEAVGQRLDTRPRRVTRLRPGTAPRPARPRARPHSAGAPRRRRARRIVMTLICGFRADPRNAPELPPCAIALANTATVSIDFPAAGFARWTACITGRRAYYTSGHRRCLTT
jgi:hypothetical protein